MLAADHPRATPSRPMLLGTALLAMSILMLQVVLIRIFSVTMSYHFAFMSISLALFGAAAGGVVVYLFPKQFPLRPGRSEGRAAGAAALFGLTMVLAVLLHLATPFDQTGNPSLVQLTWLYLALAVPFFCGGLGMALLLSAYPAQVSRIYFADLVGAGSGCLLAIPALGAFGGPGAVLVVAAVAMLAALLLGLAAGWSRLGRLAVVGLLVGLVGALALNPALQFLSVKYARGRIERDLAYEAWNSFSRISVSQELSAPGRGSPATWALSPNYRGRNPGSRNLRIDRDAGTPIARFDGNLEPLSYLRFDLSALAYRLQRPDAGPVLIIGPGGGRDILTARLFGRPDITAVEINPLVVSAVNETFGDYSGRPYYQPGVSPVVADARSFLRHAPESERYSLIQATLIDTWASSAAGAFVLTENFLYTREAFADYYRHLTDDGLLTMSRWYFRGQPSEAMRLMVLALAAWDDLGVADPDQHVMMVGVENLEIPLGLATLIAKRTPFTPEEVDSLRRQTAELGFRLIYAPGAPPADDDLGRLMTLRGPARQQFIDDYFLNVHPPTDDSPFFFNLLHPRDFLFGTPTTSQFLPSHLEAGRVLVLLLLIVGGLCLLTIVGPLAVSLARGRAAGTAVLRRAGLLFLGYAACLGLGFMLIETVLMQRFILFLGQPVYALAVILFALLVFSGLGSGLTSRLSVPRLARVQLVAVGAVVLAVMLYAVALPAVLRALLGMPEWGRVLASIGLLAPLGLLLGMPFPLGVRLAGERRDGHLIPWAWAMNGATSVLASVGSVILALAQGFTWVLLLAALVYLLALGFAAGATATVRRSGGAEERRSGRQWSVVGGQYTAR